MSEKQQDTVSPAPYQILPSHAPNAVNLKHLGFFALHNQAAGAASSSSVALIMLALYALAAFFGLGAVGLQIVQALGPALIPFLLILAYQLPYYQQFDLKWSMAGIVSLQAFFLALVNVYLKGFINMILNGIFEDFLDPFFGGSTNKKIVVLIHCILTALVCAAVDTLALHMMGMYVATTPGVSTPQSMVFYGMLAGNVVALITTSMTITTEESFWGMIVNIPSLILMGFLIASGFAGPAFLAQQGASAFMTMVAPFLVRFIFAFVVEIVKKSDVLFAQTERRRGF
eukprot:GDKI01044307.1.p1 GENE.GDKI01044307.1~~GDKI01044307.1.p1  ORF type:complete len:322 (-),score=81.02 GDKI01044307.1:156-1013(-)